MAASPVRQDKRLFISGIAPTLTGEELVKRLQNYGQVTNELVLNRKNEATTGIFGHCNVLLDGTAWSKLRKLSGTILKGSKLRIEEAKQDWVARKALDEQRPQPKVPNPRKRVPTGTLVAVESKRVKRGEVVKDSSITQKSRKQGWIKGRYGRAIAVLKTSDGTKLTRNPDALTKLWGTAHPKPDQLTYYYDDEEEEWHDRRGRIIRDAEITQKKKTIEERQGGRVEIWESDNEDAVDNQAYANDSNHIILPEKEDPMDEEAINAQLQQERSAGLEMLRDMFKSVELAPEVDKTKSKIANTVRNQLAIVPRFDPNAPELSESDEEEDQSQAENAAQDLPSEQAKSEPAAANVMQVDTDGDEDDGSDSEDEPLPSFLRPQEDAIAQTADLTSIFKPRIDDNTVDFKFALNGDQSDQEEQNVRAIAVDEMEGIHPDRLNRPHQDEEAFTDGNIENANFTVLAKDRGFNLGNVTVRSDPAPFFGLADNSDSWWTSQRSLFGASVDQESKMRSEEARAENTRAWKRREREGLKHLRKATNRQGW